MSLGLLAAAGSLTIIPGAIVIYFVRNYIAKGFALGEYDDFSPLHAATWGDMAKDKEKGFFDFEFITWMAWTWQTAAFFIFISLCLTAMVIWEKNLQVEVQEKEFLV